MDSVNEQSSRFEDQLRTIVDMTPALIHTGRPDGSPGNVLDKQRLRSV
jgi:hypothetical protein